MKFYPEHETIWGYKKRLEFLLKQIQSRYGETLVNILDVGCGNGSMISLPLAEQGYTVTGIDLDKHSIQKAQEANPFQNATFLVAKTKDLLGNQYDVVICSEVLEHIENYEPVIVTFAACASLMELCSLPFQMDTDRLRLIVFWRSVLNN
jgi:2-polyprenyl-3-methyl-5-hydroxy-6-metoxy-1,4-benzoquinol methylase